MVRILTVEYRFSDPQLASDFVEEMASYPGDGLDSAKVLSDKVIEESANGVAHQG